MQAVCKAFVDLMGGTIAIDSAYTNGTRTVVTLPLPEAADATATRQPNSPAEQPSLPPRLSWLLVDDSQDVRLSHCRVLSKAGKGWWFSEARTGEEALAFVQSGGRFDVIVVDEYMGHAGGTWL